MDPRVDPDRPLWCRFDVRAQLFIKEINDGPDMRLLAARFMAKKPKPAPALRGRKAADEVRVSLGDPTRKRGQADTLPNAGKKTRDAAVMKRNVMQKVVPKKPVLISGPRYSSAAQDWVSGKRINGLG